MPFVRDIIGQDASGMRSAPRGRFLAQVHDSRMLEAGDKGGQLLAIGQWGGTQGLSIVGLAQGSQGKVQETVRFRAGGSGVSPEFPYSVGGGE